MASRKPLQWNALSRLKPVGQCTRVRRIVYLCSCVLLWICRAKGHIRELRGQFTNGSVQKHLDHVHILHPVNVIADALVENVKVALLYAST